LSAVTGNVVLKVHDKLPDVPADIAASALAIIGGSIVLFLGLARMGWIVEFITLAAISAFMTGSAINIAAGQVPALMGIEGVKTREATYKVIINTLKSLPETNLNAAIGLSALTMLYVIRFTCAYLAKRYPSKQKMFFFASTLRTAFVILLYILISYLCNRSHRANGTDPMFNTLGDVPRGMRRDIASNSSQLTVRQDFNMPVLHASPRISYQHLQATCHPQ
jgi:sodium-independent sulfate anion transporter 11